MSITIKKTKATTKSLSSELDFLSGVVATPATKDKIKAEVGEYLVEQTLIAVSEAASPVSGEKWKKTLSPEYRDQKRDDGRGTTANMENRGDMLDALSFKPTSKGVEIGVFGHGEAKKADGHNNFSGDSELPQRRFIPAEGQNYKMKIEAEVNKIINDVIADETPVTRTQLAGVKSNSDFWDLMTQVVFPEFNRAEIRGAITRSDRISRMLMEFGLLRYL